MSSIHSFRSYGEVSRMISSLHVFRITRKLIYLILQPGYIPKDAYDIVALSKTVGVCTNDGIVTLDPTKCVLLLVFAAI